MCLSVYRCVCNLPPTCDRFADGPHTPKGSADLLCVRNGPAEMQKVVNDENQQKQQQKNIRNRLRMFLRARARMAFD